MKQGNIKMFSKLVMLLSVFIFSMNTSYAASSVEIDIEVEAAIKKFKIEVAGTDKFLKKAKGVLVFPDVVKADFQFGAQFKTVMLIFLKQDALDKFRKSSGWEAGVDGSVALVELGVGKDVNTANFEDPIVGSVFSNIRINVQLNS